MKKLLYVGLLGMFTFTSCSSDDDNISNISTEEQCALAIEASQNAEADYNSASDEDFTEACNAYKAALEAQIDVCGDEDSSIQSTIDGLGDCTAETGNGSDGTINVLVGSYPLEFDEVNVTVEGGLIKVMGDYIGAGANYSIYFEVPEGATGEGVFQNFQITTTSTFYPYTENQQFAFHNEITTNEEGILIGTFNGGVVNDDNGMLELNNGNFDLNY